MSTDQQQGRDPEVELIEKLSQLEHFLKGSNVSTGSSAVNVVVQDTRRVTVAMCCAVFSTVMFLAILIVGTILYLNMADHLDAIYMIAPHLQKELSHATAK